jgi:Leucine-rich repeat (LRR) protein
MSANQPVRLTMVMLLLLSSLLISYGVGETRCSTVPGNSTDLLSLLDFKRAIISDPRQALSSWHAGGIPHCQWEGVTCSLTHPGRVTILNLGELSLSGPIPPSVGNLTFLKILNLTVNGFNGGLPPLDRLHKLQQLLLRDNSFQGTIPETITNCSYLETLDLFGNFLIGEIPLNIGLLSNLSFLQISRNNLTGRIPPSQKNISQLLVINLADNQLTGSIPEEIGQFPNMLALLLGGNRLSGGIPTTLFN